MPKMKTHKGLKKRFKVSANGKVMHKPCGSSHLNSHKSGKKIRNLRRKKSLKVSADAARIRKALRTRESTSPAAHEAAEAAHGHAAGHEPANLALTSIIEDPPAT